MGQNVPIPESTLRRLADAAQNEANIQRRKGNNNTAKDIDEGVNRVIELAANAYGPGCFVSMDGSRLSTITAYADDSDRWPDRKTARTFLEQYGVW